jgi:hypothetical protein
LLLFLDGSLEPDQDAAYFRLYRQPQDRRSYLLIKKADVAGDLYEWTVEEMTQAGFVGAKVYRVPLKFGTELQNVSVTIARLGETIAGATVSLAPPPDLDFVRQRAARISYEALVEDVSLRFQRHAMRK